MADFLGDYGDSLNAELDTANTPAWGTFDAPDLTGYQAPNVEEGNVPTVIPDGNVDANGNPTYVDAAGNPVNADGTPIAAVPDQTITGGEPDASTLQGLLTKITKGGFTASDLAKYVSANPGTASGILGLLSQLSGFNTKTTGGYSGKIPSYTAQRQKIDYNDPNRRPGSGGRQYFTDTTYNAPAGTAATQAAGILANYKPAEATAPKWNATNAVAMPWAKKAVASAEPVSASAAFVSPEERLAALKKAQEVVASPTLRAPTEATFIGGAPEIVSAPAPSTQKMTDPNVGPQRPFAQGGIMEAAQGRYLRGDTDGMADEIDTSIDGDQPAKLSHGEFVVPADVVSHLGNGNSDAGADKLYQMMDKIRMARTGTKEQGKQINPDKFLPGGAVSKYAKGGITDVMPKRFATGGNTSSVAADTTTSSTLSPWAGDYVTDMLGKGQALSNQPYQTYGGPLTAGASDLQQQQFSGISNLAQTGITPTQFTKGTFDTSAAQKYMNPYIQTALDPQLKEMQRQADIARLSDAGRLTQAGAYGGSRQAIMESEGRRNLLDKQAQAIGTGYQTAYDKAMQQYNADMARGLSTEQAQEAANQASAKFGLESLNALGQAGATQRDIEQQGIAADKAQFEEQRDYPYKMVQYQQGLLQGLPISTQTNTPNTNPLLEFMNTQGGILNLLKQFGYATPTSSGTTKP